MIRKTNPEVAQLWRERLARQAQGSWSIAKFCRHEGVSEAAFYYWQRRLGRAHATGRGNGPNRRSAKQPLFLSVEVDSDSGGPDIEIELPGGGVVRLPHNASAEIVSAAVRAACLEQPRKEEQAC